MDRRLLELDGTSLFCSLADFILPRECAVCGRRLLPGEKYLCLCCMADLPLTYFSSQIRNPMADLYNAKFDAEEYEPYQRAAALFYYSAVAGGAPEQRRYARIPQEVKYHRNFKIGGYFSSLLGKSLSEGGLFDDVDAIVPVPLHWTRLYRRGYNQSEIIARGIALAFPGAEVKTDLLYRTRKTRTQTAIHSALDKRENVLGAFGVMPCAKSYKHILLVDDTFTTGATLAECHNVLRKALGGEVKISAATLAFIGAL